MGGRGRGRNALSFNVESLGITPGEALPGPVLQPPPTYPILEFTPAPLLRTINHMQCLNYKLEYLKFYSRLKVDFVQTEDTTLGNKKKHDSSHKVHLDYDWSRFPVELQPQQFKKFKSSGKLPSAPRKTTDVNELLEHLEKAERIVKVEKMDKEDMNEDKAEGEDENVEEEDSDNEMDGGTDYNQNYFDNGEGYLDEDDDLDDGPIY